MRSIFLLAFVFLLSSCAVGQRKTGVELQNYSFEKLSGWEEKNIVGGLKSFQRTCSAIFTKKIQSQRIFSDNTRIWQDKCISSRNARNSKRFFEDNFSPYLVTYNGTNKGIFTGYFEKDIDASFKKDSVYKHPIYAAPSDPALLNLSRKQIESGALAGKNLEIAYAKSAAELFFLHIQGSGILKLPDGKRVEVGFSGKNNKPYTGIGKPMLAQGLIQHGTAKDIQDWLESHPVSARSIMNMNERYVFFTLKKGGPYGSLGVELTDMSSLAVDPNYIPLGTPMWLQTTMPGSRQYFTKLMAAQDTGGDIIGGIRGDIFFGEGDWAENIAGKMKQQGSYFMLLPKEINAGSYF